MPKLVVFLLIIFVYNKIVCTYVLQSTGVSFYRNLAQLSNMA